MKISPNNVKLGCSSCSKGLDESISATINLDSTKGLKTKSSKIVSIINQRTTKASKINGLF